MCIIDWLRGNDSQANLCIQNKDYFLLFFFLQLTGVCYSESVKYCKNGCIDGSSGQRPLIFIESLGFSSLTEQCYDGGALFFDWPVLAAHFAALKRIF